MRVNRQTWQLANPAWYPYNSPLLRLTSRKQLWLDLQPVDIKSRWRHNWKSDQVVNSHLVCNPTIRQLDFDLPGQQWSLLITEPFLHGTGDTAVPVEGNGDLQSLICVLVARPRRCPILSPDKTEWWLISYTLRMKTLFHGWPIMVHDMHMRRRRLWVLFRIYSKIIQIGCRNFNLLWSKETTMEYHEHTDCTVVF